MAPPTSGSPARTSCSSSPSARSTSCSISGSGAARWSWPRAAATTRSASRCAASAVSASRPSTRGSPRTTSPSTGRQAEIVEVKGSVELAPLTGLVDGIVDLTATGTTLAENDLEVVEDIVVCTARLIANPVAHKLKAERDRRSRRAGEGGGVKITEFGSDPGGGRDPRARAVRAGGRGRRPRDRRRPCATAATRPCCELTERFDGVRLETADLRVPVAEIEAALAQLDPAVRGRPGDRDRERAGGRRGPAAATPSRPCSKRDTRSRSPRRRCVASARTCRRAARPIPRRS